MQPRLLRHTAPIEGSFKVWKNANPYLHNPWHYHPEYEITLIEKGVVHDLSAITLRQYNDMDLLLLGSYLPHEWHSDLMPKEETDYISSSMAIHFKHDFLGHQFYSLPESKEFNKLLERAKFGIKIQDKSTINKVRFLIYEMLEKTDFNRLIIFLELLHELTECQNYKLLSSEGFTNSWCPLEDQKINLVYEYIIRNFKNNIALHEIASIINMSPASFCRYFRQRTHKTFIQYLNEIKTGYAKKLLIEDKYNISQAAYECGFNNLSNFNKQFIKNTGMTPKEYKNKVSIKRSKQAENV